MIDGHDGERHNCEEVELDHLLEIRRGTVEALFDGDSPGRSWWRDQLNQIDDEIAYRTENEGAPITAVESPYNRLWRDYVMALSDALSAERRRQHRQLGVLQAVALLGRYTGVPQTLGELITA